MYCILYLYGICHGPKPWRVLQHVRSNLCIIYCIYIYIYTYTQRFNLGLMTFCVPTHNCRIWVYGQLLKSAIHPKRHSKSRSKSHTWRGCHDIVGLFSPPVDPGGSIDIKCIQMSYHLHPMPITFSEKCMTSNRCCCCSLCSFSHFRIVVYQHPFRHTSAEMRHIE